MKRINITITPRHIKKLDEHSKITELSRSELLRRILDDYFKTYAPISVELIENELEPNT